MKKKIKTKRNEKKKSKITMKKLKSKNKIRKVCENPYPSGYLPVQS